jgi:putative flippase GtrA
MNPGSTLERKSWLRNPLDIPIEFVARRFGEKSREVERFLRFAVVGVTGALIDFGLLFFLQATLLHPVDQTGTPIYIIPGLLSNTALATTIAFFCAVTSNFIWTRLWVYPESRSTPLRVQLVQFILISIVGGVCRTVWINFAYLPMGHWLMPAALPFIQVFRPGYVPSVQAPAKLGTLVAQMIGMVVVMLWNFFANRYWTYKDVK